jgi:hypothetical protein
MEGFLSGPPVTTSDAAVMAQIKNIFGQLMINAFPSGADRLTTLVIPSEVAAHANCSPPFAGRCCLGSIE